MAQRGLFKFPKTLRLRRREEFLSVQRQGRRRRGRYVVVMALCRQQGPTRLGVTVSRRVGPAVIRNRIKRMIREAFRQQRHHFPPSLDLVVVARRGAADASLNDLKQELLQALLSLDKLLFDPRQC